MVINPVLTNSNIKEYSRINLICWINSLNIMDKEIDILSQLDDGLFYNLFLEYMFPGTVSEVKFLTFAYHKVTF